MGVNSASRAVTEREDRTWRRRWPVNMPPGGAVSRRCVDDLSHEAAGGQSPSASTEPDTASSRGRGSISSGPLLRTLLTLTETG